MIVSLKPKDEFIETYYDWCKQMHFAQFPKELMPDDFIVVNNGESDIYASPIYFPLNGAIAQIFLLVKNPNIPDKERANGIDEMINETEKFLKTFGYKGVMIFTDSHYWEKKLNQHDYITSRESDKIILKRWY